MPAEIYLVRHGETQWNRDRRVQGQLDSPLTPRGHDQVRRIGQLLARVLAGVGPLPVHVSPLGRTRTTVAILGEELALGPMTIEPRLAELSLGSWDGLTWDQVQARHADLLAGATEHTWYFRAPDGESFASASRRLAAWQADLTEPVIAVSHGMVGRILRAIYLNLPRDEALAYPLPQDEVWHFRQGEMAVLRATEPTSP
jgi:probable phosphoglycerate mutase